MGHHRSKYSCIHCGEHKLDFPAIKGEYGWVDTSKYICSACGKESPYATVRELAKAAITAAKGEA